ncbi:metallophosphoesterase [Salinigranum rubrum]|uniref:Metallophosphoesterase n=1 Tax=Salinigranum rubrum TaxID=755307 RepID=A0A2I8VPP7_9EURY|nr:metallophosphoesterase [Salinigranum rubrum]
MFDAVFADRAVSFGSKALVVADLHVGRAEASDVEVPLGERADLTERLGEAVDRLAPETVVVAGDVLHEFGRVSHRAAETLALLDEVCREAGAELVLVAGNHDRMLESVWDGEVHDQYRVDAGDREVLVCHGHEEPRAEADCYVVGHDHPTITIEGQKRPCFLAGEGVYDGGDLLMLPAFSRVASGVSVNGMRARDFQSPLVSDANALRPIVWDRGREEALTFPPLGRFRKML